jgi:hypothetical protein
MYISSTKGLTYSDDYLENEIDSKYHGKDLSLWSHIVAEQIIRLCIEYSVSETYFMIRNRKEYLEIRSILKRSGISVNTPIMGYKTSIVDKLLML